MPGDPGLPGLPGLVDISNPKYSLCRFKSITGTGEAFLRLQSTTPTIIMMQTMTPTADPIAANNTVLSVVAAREPSEAEAGLPEDVVGEALELAVTVMDVVSDIVVVIVVPTSVGMTPPI